ncbi:MAG: helix-turn-helix transcriptional regulator [Brevundimonas sp.]|uniref:DNA-binding HxlR family transcriptional regulator n=1 Tax=Brevundimonas mediterranea TaxID=74329 RepID=A0A7W6A233_9CAUL|nr:MULTISPECIES: helix-turn-helix domain-containing protein [Brevundimonas]MBB3870827.1 DNA-binding HxlR family transcriptional regulator [Brevundimonas mediterranea]MDK2748728.1 helix-turn-helix transcriptional regulator [Brevundimonas sp.]
MERALAVVGDRWALTILRDAFLGVRRFEDFQRRSAMARNVLAKRLALLVGHGVLARTVYQDRPIRHEYRLTSRGQGLFPVILSLASWGQAYLTEDHAPAPLFRHRGCDHDMRPVLACSACGGELHARSVELNLETDTGDGAAVRAFAG